ncbi:MAG: hypothetical protein KA159_10340 [Halioglobus sp.]|nr:hypothetical protein [Halioglobus sp.]
MTPSSRHSPASLGRQALAHGGFALLLVALLLAAHSWTGTGPAAYLLVAWAFLTGLALSHIVHEWCHFLGATAARSALTLKPCIHPLFFDYDFAKNTQAQFLCLSIGGLLGNVLLLSLALLFAGSQSAVMTAFLAAVAGQLVFVLILELPVSIGVMAGRDPLRTLEQHFSQGGPLFLRAGIGGLATAALVFLLC